jgi:hypothetical protein
VLIHLPIGAIKGYRGLLCCTSFFKSGFLLTVYFYWYCKMSKQTICLNMNVKNNGDVILDCIRSIHHLIDYYEILDTGSTDDTCHLITNFFDSKKILGSIRFGENRTYRTDIADYMLFMDADFVCKGKLVFPRKLTFDIYFLNMRSETIKPLLVRNCSELKTSFHIVGDYCIVSQNEVLLFDDTGCVHL